MRPDAEDVLRRLLVLKHIIALAYHTIPADVYKQINSKWSASERNKFELDYENIKNSIIASLKNLSLWDFTSNSEKNFLLNHKLSSSNDGLANAIWRLESALVLMWALHLIDRLPDLNKDSDHLLLSLIPNHDLKILDNQYKLRTEEEIELQKIIIESWHWRLNTKRLIDTNYPFYPDESFISQGINNLDDIVRMSAINAFKNKWINEIIDDDFVYQNCPIRNINEDQFATIYSTIYERHFAINWLCGYSPDNNWDETPIDT